MKLRTLQTGLHLGLAFPFPMFVAVLVLAPQLIWVAGGAGAALLLAALGFATWLGRRLEHDLDALAAPARALGAGALPTFPRSRIGEIGSLGRELENAATLLKTLLDEHDDVEERLCRSEERYRGVVDYSQEMIWIHTDGKVIFANDAAARGLGVATPEDLVGHDVLSFYHPDDAPFIRQRMKEIYESGGRLAPAEYRMVRADGQIVHIEAQPMPFWYEGASSILVMAHDITERRRAEVALRASEQRFRDFADVASDWLWELGPDLRFTYVSERVIDTGAAAPSFFIGKSPIELAEPVGDRAVVRAHLDNLKAQRPFRDVPTLAIRPGGRVVKVRVSGKPVFDEDGRFAGYRGATRIEPAEADAAPRAGPVMEAVA